MKKQDFTERMKQHESKFDAIWQDIVSDVNEYIKDNPEETMYSLNSVDKFTDSLCLSGAWIQDRINGKSGVSSNPKYRGSLTKKIRKALGYTF